MDRYKYVRWISSTIKRHVAGMQVCFGSTDFILVRQCVIHGELALILNGQHWSVVGLFNIGGFSPSLLFSKEIIIIIIIIK